ncbi:MAG: hypothetical protein VX947_02170 [Chloroflexota bacterium]|nr:hypothetical protein [Chloroflexota bacterium]
MEIPAVPDVGITSCAGADELAGSSIMVVEELPHLILSRHCYHVEKPFSTQCTQIHCRVLSESTCS